MPDVIQATEGLIARLFAADLSQSDAHDAVAFAREALLSMLDRLAETMPAVVEVEA